MTIPTLDEGLDPHRRMGIVTGIAADRSTVTVLLAGDTTNEVPLAYLSSYAPQVGDAVFILASSGDMFVLGATSATSVESPTWYTAGKVVGVNQTTGLPTGANLTTILSQTIGVAYPWVSVDVAWFLGVAKSNTPSGNLGNTPIALITDSQLWPTHAQPLYSSGTGPLAGYTITTTGVINVNAVSPGAGLTATSADAFSVGGQYRLG